MTESQTQKFPLCKTVNTELWADNVKTTLVLPTTASY